MNNTVTLGEIFAKAQDCLTPSFNSVQFEADVDNLSKAETENLLGQIQAEILKGGDYDTLTEMRSIALDHITDIEKAVYADNAQNRKLGRVGQEYGGVGSRGGKGKTPQERQAAFKQKHAALVDKWKKEGNIAGLKKEIAAIKMEYGSDRQTAEKKIKPLEDAIAAAKSKKHPASNAADNKTQQAKSSDIGNRIISALKADQGGLNNSSSGKKAQMNIIAAAENFMKKNPKVKFSDEDLESIVGGDIDEVEEKYGELKGWNKLNDAIELYFDAD